MLAMSNVSSAQGPSEAASTPTFRSNVSEVRVTFFASEGGSRPVEVVTPADFAVVDDGTVIRNFRSFSKSEETSLDIVALIDLSQSVAPRFRTAVSDVLQLVAREQSLPENNISVLTFSGTRPAILCSNTCHDSSMVNVLLGEKSSGLTPLYDALALAADFFAHHYRPSARPVLILFSDGNDTISLHGPQEATESLINSGAVVYAVDISVSKSAGSQFLRRIADSTGGRYFTIQDGAATVLGAVLDDLRASYVVTYALPSRQTGVHSLRLLPTRNLNLKFHSRATYNYDNAVR
jgi:VWFA-related protein